MKLVVVPLAPAELHDAAAFYTARASIELGLALVAVFERTANLVLENPMFGQSFVVRDAAIICAGFPPAASIRSPLKNFASLRWRIIGDVQATGQNASGKPRQQIEASCPMIAPPDMRKKAALAVNAIVDASVALLTPIP